MGVTDARSGAAGSGLADEKEERHGLWLTSMALLSVYAIWGSTYLAVRFADKSLPPLLMSGTRYTLAGLILFTVLRLAGSPLRFIGRILRISGSAAG